MINRFARCVVFPAIAFVGVVSVGFGAWAFQEGVQATDEVTVTTYVTAVTEDFGEVVVNNGDDYTAENQYYTLVFSQDQTLDETVGVNLHPSIEYKFSNFPEAPSGYSYFISYKTLYKRDSIYDRYVEIVDVADSGPEIDPTDGSERLFQTSKPVTIDMTGMTAVSQSISSDSELYIPRFTITKTFTPSFKWRSSSKPTTESAYNEFLKEVNASEDTFSIVLIITCTYSGTGT